MARRHLNTCMSNNVQIPTTVGAPTTTIETIDEGGGVSRQVIVLGSIGDASGETQLSAGQKTSANSIPVVVASDQSAVPVSGTFWQTTQPVSGTVTANAGTNLNTSALALESGGNLATLAGTVAGGKVKVDPSGVTSPISAASLPLPSNAAQETGGNLATIATAQGAGGTGISEPAGGSGILGWLSGIYHALINTLTVSGTVTANAGTNLNTSALALESGGNLATIAGTVAAGKVATTISGSVAVSGTFWQTTQPISAAALPLPSNAAQETGGNLATLAGAVSAAKVQTTVATALPAGTNALGGIYAAPTASSSFGIAPGSSSALESSHVLKASAGNLYSLYVATTTASGWLMTFNATSIPADGAVTPVEAIQIPTNSAAAISFDGAPPDYYSTGIVAVFSTTGPFTKTASATAFFKWRVE